MPRDVASRAAKKACDDGYGVGSSGLAVCLDFRDAIKRQSEDVIRAKYGNLFQMYEKITDEDPYRVPMNIYPAVHYTMGGLWVDYNLMSNIPGLFVLGEANFSDHGANRLGASALMQGLADGYFVIPATLGGYLGQTNFSKKEVSNDSLEFKEAVKNCEEKIAKFLNLKGNKPVDDFHRELGRVMWDHCGMSRSQASLKKALSLIPEIRERFWREAVIPGAKSDLNQTLEKSGRVADFLEFGELMCRDALEREESCGGHFREEHQTEENEAKRDDKRFCHVAVWEYQGKTKTPNLHKENLVFENVKPIQRSYK